MTREKNLSALQIEELLMVLQARFIENRHRHEGLEWTTIENKLKLNNNKLWSLHAMESTGGEPDVVNFDKETEEYIFYDCAPETPAGRRSICYDREGLESRKSNKPDNNAVDLAKSMGVELLSEAQYFALQKLENFDTKTSSWLKTPPAIRNLGGAIFGDFRYDRVFIYHNGAQSYYGSRGFRGVLKV